MSRPLLDQTLGSLNYEEEDRTLRSFEYGEERKNGDRCENCIRRGTRCVRVLRTLAAANACQACRSSRIRCSFVADRKKKERGSNPDLTLEQKSPLRLSPSFEAERQSKITALMGHPGDGVLVDFDGNDTTGWASIPRNTPQNSENSGNQTIGGSSSSHGHSHEVDEIITEQARQLAIAYAPLPLSFRQHDLRNHERCCHCSQRQRWNDVFWRMAEMGSTENGRPSESRLLRYIALLTRCMV
jgi:hypothetical protein